uniref:RRM domain-containing protein n=1 Tax=Gongylonema pulchrum TaxID=637853 RepID=A0A183CY68_9BILA
LFVPLQGSTNGGAGFLATSLPGSTLDNEAKKAKLDRSISLLASASGMVLPSAQQQILTAVALAGGAPLLHSPAIFNQTIAANNEKLSFVDTSLMAATTSSSVLNGQQISRVVHLRNIPSDMTDLELVHFCMPYGKLVNYLLLKGRNQAFVEYEDEQSAQTLVTVSATCPVAIRDRLRFSTIFCQFSTHQELKTNRRPYITAVGGGANIGDRDDCAEVC